MPLPDSVQLMLNDYLTLMQTELPGLMTGCYLHGSLVLDAFTPNLSDVDFITVVSRRCTEADIERLRAVHRQVEQTHPSAPLQGSYLQPQDLGQFPNAVECGPCYSDGVLEAAGHHDLNSITWWLLKHRGITLMGPDASTLDFTVDWDALEASTKKNLNTYWVTYIRKPERIAWLFSDYGIQWTILGTLRQWYTFKEHGITSKSGAGEHALKHLPTQWHRIIREAVNLRGSGSPSLYRSRIVRALDAWRFLRFIIRECNTTFA